MAKKLKCPVCGTPLSQAQFDKALGLWQDKQEHIKHLEDEQKKLKEQQRLVEKKYKDAEKKFIIERQNLRKQSTRHLQEQKSKLLNSFNQRIKTEVKQGIELGVKQQKKEFEKQTSEFKKTQNKMKQLESSLKISANKYEKANEEIKKLKEQIEKGITPQIEGLLEENILLAKLKELYPHDKFIHTGKGGDIIQIILEQKKEIGKIVYECKKVKKYDPKFIKQAKDARKIREADFAVLVTNAFPSKKQYYFVEKTVFVISPVSLEPITYTLRESLVRISILKISNEAKQIAVQRIYDYLSSNDYNNRVNDVSIQLIDLAKDLKKEIDSHRRTWEKRYSIYGSIYKDVGIIDYKLKDLVRNKIDGKPSKQLEAPKSEFVQIKELQN
ncbi:MAG: DUF2130 domain-containing protein [Melioribacteraceae bacterium]